MGAPSLVAYYMNAQPLAVDYVSPESGYLVAFHDLITNATPSHFILCLHFLAENPATLSNSVYRAKPFVIILYTLS